MMNRERLEQIVSQFPHKKVVVFGDFFLDRYLIVDRSLDEVSIETGKTAYQIVGKRPQPGAAGTVCNNLHALGIGTIIALSVIGDDGEGYELRKALSLRNVTTENLIIAEDRFTPTYTKPMMRIDGGEEEMNRQDIKNRVPMSEDLEQKLIQTYLSLLDKVDAVIVADQVQERNCGVITDRVREAIAASALNFPHVVFFADSRTRIGEFTNVMIKPNRFEAVQCIDASYRDTPSTPMAIDSALRLRAKTGRPVFLTLDKEGICPIDGGTPTPIPCPPVTGPIDIVGAGDSTTAGIVSSLISGASLKEAATIGNLVASVTIRQLGTTGTASPAQVFEAFDTNQDLYLSLK